MPAVRLLGVDPGTETLGWGVIERKGRTLSLVGCGAHRAPRGAASVAERLASLTADLAGTIRTYRPDVAAVERAFFGKNAKAALRVGEARGAVLAELARAGVPVEDVTPREVKKAVVGTGGAQKRQVQLMTGAILECAPPDDLDASDALAAAICLAHRMAGRGSSRTHTAGPKTRGGSRA
jgi:crossover junction endodeoxyribonuclease RuvC